VRAFYIAVSFACSKHASVMISSSLRIALVHDYLIRYGGAERVLFAFHKLFPHAPIYTLFYAKHVTEKYFPNAQVRASSLQRFPYFLKRRYRYLAPFLVSAVEQFNLQEFDIVISSSSAFCKGIITRPQTIHICYCHTPTRFLWDWTHRYTAGTSLRMVASIQKFILHGLRTWDFAASQRPDYMIANSYTVRSRIRKFYGRDAHVIYPPVVCPSQSEEGACQGPAGESSVPHGKDYFLIVSYLQKYKNVDIAVEAFSKLGIPLVVIGEGPQLSSLRSIGGAFNIFFRLAE